MSSEGDAKRHKYSEDPGIDQYMRFLADGARDNCSASPSSPESSPPSSLEPSTRFCVLRAPGAPIRPTNYCAECAENTAVIRALRTQLQMEVGKNHRMVAEIARLEHRLSTNIKNKS